MDSTKKVLKTAKREKLIDCYNLLAECYFWIWHAKDALTAIRQQSPDLVFLDVEMPKMNGFELVEQLPAINFHLIFTTSYDQYALKAIRLLKDFW